MIELHEHHVYIVDYFSCVRVHVALQFRCTVCICICIFCSLSLSLF